MGAGPDCHHRYSELCYSEDSCVKHKEQNKATEAVAELGEVSISQRNPLPFLVDFVDTDGFNDAN